MYVSVNSRLFSDFVGKGGGRGVTVNPNAPIRFQNPICHPRTSQAGTYHLGCVSSIYSMPEMMKPDPPTICGTQKMPSKRPCDILLLMPGRAVKPDIWLYVSLDNFDCYENRFAHPEDGSTTKLGKGCKKAEFSQVMCFEFVP